jgi:hypothetical protein
MKAIFTWLIICFAVIKLFPQNLLCTEIPLQYKSDSISFGKSNADSPGDSMMVIPIINLSDTTFYDPSAKLIAVTVLPGGTSIINAAVWKSFIPVFKPGQTAYAGFYFKVDSLIPPEFKTTFQLWLSDRVKAVFDSCEFDTTFTVNLNPQIIPEVLADDGWEAVRVYPVPAIYVLHIVFKPEEETNAVVSVCDISGKMVMQQQVNSEYWDMDVSELTAGAYILRIATSGSRGGDPEGASGVRSLKFSVVR